MSACHREMVQPGVVLGQWWHHLDDGRIQCDLCPRECKLREGQRGFCFVRQAQNGGVVLTTYGRASGFCIDPIEKKPLNHFYPGTSVLSFGTAGCAEAAVVEGVDVYGASSLSQVVHFLRGDVALEPVRSNNGWPEAGFAEQDLDFGEVNGQQHVKRAVEVAVVGGHKYSHHRAYSVNPGLCFQGLSGRRISGSSAQMKFQIAIRTGLDLVEDQPGDLLST